MPFELFYQIVEIYNAEIVRLSQALSNALSDDAADDATIAEAQARATEWENTASQIQMAFDEYKAKNPAQPEQLIGVMTEIKNRLQPA